MPSGRSCFSSCTPCSAKGRNSALRQNSCLGSSVSPAAATSSTTSTQPRTAEHHAQRAVDAAPTRLRDPRQQRVRHAGDQHHADHDQREGDHPLRQRTTRPVRRDIRHDQSDVAARDHDRRDPADQPENLGHETAPRATQRRQRDHRQYSVVESRQHRALLRQTGFAHLRDRGGSRRTIRERARNSVAVLPSACLRCSTYAGTPADFNLVAHERAVASSLNEPSCTAKRAPAGDDGDEASLLSGLAASACATAAGAGAGFGAAGFATGRPVSARASAASRSPWSWYRVSRPACRHPSARAPVQPQRRHRMPAVRRARRLPVRRTRHRRAVRPPARAGSECRWRCRP